MVLEEHRLVLTSWFEVHDFDRQGAPAKRRGAAAALCGVAAGMGFLTSAAMADVPKIDIELNKLEAQEKGCRAYFVVGNDTTAEYDSFKLDLVLFQPDGVINKRVIVNLAPVKAQKRTVKQFDLEGTPCDQVGNLLINDIIECKAPAGPVEGCLSGLTVKSLTKVQLSK